MERAADLKSQNRPPLAFLATLDDEIDAASRIGQTVLKARQTRDRQTASQFLFCPGKFQTIYDSLCRHKGRMIVFLGHAVKEKGRKTHVRQALRLSPPRLILASASVYRRDLLKRLRLRFDVVAPNVDETPLLGEPAERTALRLAEVKARAAAQPGQIALIIGSDQVAVMDEQVLGKPGTHDNAVRQLEAMRGKSVVFHTALCLYNSASDRVQVANVPTTVVFRHFSDAQIERYLASERPYDCAGSAKIEGLGIALVERVVSDDPTALIGLPLLQLTSMLRSEGVEVI